MQDFPHLSLMRVNGLHGEKTVAIQFQRGVSIIASENGAGKTTILNILFLILNKQLRKLAKINFQSVLLQFSNGKSLEIFRHELESYEIDERRKRIPNAVQGMLEFIDINLDADGAEALLNAARLSNATDIRRIVKKIASNDNFEISPSVIRYFIDYPEAIIRLIVEKRVRDFLLYFPYRVVYLPTYRRVEEDSSNLGVSTRSRDMELFWDDDEENQLKAEILIRFGMGDVRERFEKITQKIKDDTMSSYSKIGGSMLEELLHVPNFSSDNVSEKIQANQAGLTLVLNRIGSSISRTGRRAILKLVSSGGILEEKYRPLAYVLANLIKIYEDQKSIDDRINHFVATVNRYFKDKKLVYDEVDPRLYVSSLRTEVEIDLEMLSSGEKQLISILSLLYLEEDEYALIFDEPELSLSTEWQQKLLPDIRRSGSCRFLLAATHSPYIFDNELVNLAMPLLVRYEN